MSPGRASRLDTFLSAAMRRHFCKLLMLAVIATGTLWPRLTLADDLAAKARSLLAEGMKPEAIAERLMEQGADPEDAAVALFAAAPNLRAMRAVAFTVVRAGVGADGAAAVPLAAGVAGLAQPAPVPAAIAIALTVPDQAATAAGALSEAAPQAAPLIAAITAKLVPRIAAEVAAAVARAVPSQTLFISAAVLQAAPAERDRIIAAVAGATGLKPELLAAPDAVVEAVGGNALREALEVLADLPVARTE
jgi:hypothetical protein